MTITLAKWQTRVCRSVGTASSRTSCCSAPQRTYGGVYEAWWTANSWYPNRTLGERLTIAERAVRELLAGGLITLVRNPMDGADDTVPRDQHDEVLHSWDSWVIGTEGIKVGYAITDAGLLALREALRPSAFRE